MIRFLKFILFFCIALGSNVYASDTDSSENKASTKIEGTVESETDETLKKKKIILEEEDKKTAEKVEDEDEEEEDLGDGDEEPDCD